MNVDQNIGKIKIKNKIIEIIINKIKECDKLEEECKTKIRGTLKIIDGELVLYTSILNVLYQYLKYWIIYILGLASFKTFCRIWIN